MDAHNPLKRVLAVRPTTRGFGFVVFEGPRFLVEWGTRQVQSRDKNWECRSKVLALIKHYRPEVVVTEDVSGPGARRCPRVRRLLQDLGRAVSKLQVRFLTVRKGQIRAAFCSHEALTKHQVANCLGQLYPELACRLPPVRKPWMSEDPRMSIFEAAALAVTFYFHEEKRKLTRQARAQTGTAENNQ